MPTNKLTLNLKHDHEVIVENKGTPNKVFLLLHGYLLDGKYLFETLKDIIPNNSMIIAPNGPFMVPVKKKDEFHAKFAWYFFDPAKKNYYINFDPAADYLKQIVETYNTDSLPVHIIGYSQGGYLAPRAAEEIPHTKSVLGIACTFREGRYEYQPNIIYNQINSIDDPIVEIEGSRTEFEKLKALGNKGELVELSGTGHKIDQTYLVAIKNYLANL